MGAEFSKYVLRTRRPEDAEQFAEDFQRRAREMQRKRGRRSETVIAAIVLLVGGIGLLAWAVFAG